MEISYLLAVIIFFLMIVLIYYFSKNSKNLSIPPEVDKNFVKLEEINEQTKKATLEAKDKIIEEISQKLKTNEEITKILLDNINKNIKEEVVSQQKLFQEKNKELNERINKESKETSEKINKDLELRLNNSQQLIKQYLENSSKELSGNQQLIKTHLENYQKGILQPLEKLNSILLHSGKRGAWGNTQLDQLLSLYLPKSDKIYQMEFKLNKKRSNSKEEGLRVDAIVFSADGKNNIAIDSKFPLENYLSSADSSLTEQQKEEFEKKFENDVKEHIKKVAEYNSDEDGIKYTIMFVPSEVIFSKINEQRYYSIIKLTLEKKVAICSPAILLIIIDQLRSWNKTWEQYKELDKITSDIAKFWDNLELFKKRWDKIVKTIESNNENIRQFNISTKKLIEGGEKIKDRENNLPQILPKTPRVIDLIDDD